MLPDIEVALLRTAQEALANLAKVVGVHVGFVDTDLTSPPAAAA
jgi:hypothetical protein